MNPVLGLGSRVTREIVYVTTCVRSGRRGHPGDCGRVTQSEAFGEGALPGDCTYTPR